MVNQVFRTTDGKIFDNEKDADIHQSLEIPKENVKELLLKLIVEGKKYPIYNGTISTEDLLDELFGALGVCIIPIIMDYFDTTASGKKALHKIYKDMREGKYNIDF